MRAAALLSLVLLGVTTLPAGDPAAGPVSENAQLLQRLEALEEKLEQTSFTLDRLMKKTDDLLWFERVGDVADIGKFGSQVTAKQDLPTAFVQRPAVIFVTH